MESDGVGWNLSSNTWKFLTMVSLIHKYADSSPAEHLFSMCGTLGPLPGAAEIIVVTVITCCRCLQTLTTASMRSCKGLLPPHLHAYLCKTHELK